jgi:hypothetical protein
MLRVTRFTIVSINVSDDNPAVEGQVLDCLTYHIRYVRVGKSGPMN